MSFTQSLTSEHPQIQAAAEMINAGGIVAFPTETVYGLGADATNSTAVEKIFRIKQRPTDHPLIVHIGDYADLTYWAQAIPESAWQLASQFWPGPLTMILQRNHRIPDCVTGGQNTVGIRIPAHPIALALLKALGPDKALAAPSANRFGRISPTTAMHVQQQLGNDVDLILDGGACSVGLESTIISFHHRTPEILRPGGITALQIEAVLNMPVTNIHPGVSSIRASGTLPAHYAPNTPLKLMATEHIWPQAVVLAEQNFRVLVMTWSTIFHDRANQAGITHCAMPNTPFMYGKLLYAKLHQFDQAGFDYLLIEAPPIHSDWLAVADRLQRASYSFTHSK